MLTVRIATQSRGIALLCAIRLYKVIRLIVQKSKMASFRRTFFPLPVHSQTSHLLQSKHKCTGKYY